MHTCTAQIYMYMYCTNVHVPLRPLYQFSRLRIPVSIINLLVSAMILISTCTVYMYTYRICTCRPHPSQTSQDQLPDTSLMGHRNDFSCKYYQLIH